MRFIFYYLISLIFYITSSTVASSVNPTGFAIENASIDSIRKAIESKNTTCQNVIERYLDRIKLYNITDHAPPLNTITTITPSVIEQSILLDQEFAKTGLVNKLHCVPVVIKDNIDSYDSPSSSGSLSMLGNQPLKDALVVKKLRENGAIIIAKSSMDELASGMYGISSRNGRTGNAFNSSLNPGGSSSGSAVAVSSNFAVIGIGTDNSGSVRIPAAFNGIFGLRPSYGLISQSGIFPRGNLDGIAGPMARSVTDLALTLEIIAETDNKDQKASTINRPPVSYTKYLKKDGLKGKRIGIVTVLAKSDLFAKIPAEIKTIFNQLQEKLKHNGAIIIDNITLPDFDINRNNNQAGEKEDINNYLKTFPSIRKNYNDICKSGRTNFLSINKCLDFVGNLPPKDGAIYKNALSIFDKNKIYIESIMTQYNLDALLVLVSDKNTASYDTDPIAELISSNSGLPALTFPAGYTNDNLPVGAEIIGKKFDEAKLVEIAYSYEQNTSPLLNPQLISSSDQLRKLSIAEYNNLITLIGYTNFVNVAIKQGKALSYKTITPENFRKLVDVILIEEGLKN